MTFSSPADAQDAIDNMDLNELRGKVLRVNLARPTKMPLQPQGNRASKSATNLMRSIHAQQPSLQSGNQKIGSNNMPSRSRKAVVRSISHVARLVSSSLTCHLQARYSQLKLGTARTRPRSRMTTMNLCRNEHLTNRKHSAIRTPRVPEALYANPFTSLRLCWWRRNLLFRRWSSVADTRGPQGS